MVNYIVYHVDISILCHVNVNFEISTVTKTLQWREKFVRFFRRKRENFYFLTIAQFPDIDFALFSGHFEPFLILWHYFLGRVEVQNHFWGLCE